MISIVYVPTKDLDLDPVSGDESTIPEGEQFAQVSTTPEEVRSDTSGSQLHTTLVRKDT